MPLLPKEDEDPFDLGDCLNDDITEFLSEEILDEVPAQIPGSLGSWECCVRGFGLRAAAIADRVAKRIRRELSDGTEVTVVEPPFDSIEATPIVRVARQFGEGDETVTVMKFRTRDDDLVVQMKHRPRTWLSSLRRAVAVAAFLVCFSTLMACTAFLFDGRNHLARGYAQRHARDMFDGQDKSMFYRCCIQDGYVSFDNRAFVEKLNAGNAPRLLRDAIADPDSARVLTGRTVSDGNSLTEEAHLLALHSMVESLRMDAIAHYGTQKLAFDGYQHRYFVRLDHDRPIALNVLGTLMESTAPVLRIDSDKSLELARYLCPDFGDQHAELTQQFRTAFQESVKEVPPWSTTKLIKKDPLSAIFQLGFTAILLTLILGTLLYFLPMWTLNAPCRLLGRPTYAEFLNAVTTHHISVERILLQTLKDAATPANGATRRRGVSV